MFLDFKREVHQGGDFLEGDLIVGAVLVIEDPVQGLAVQEIGKIIVEEALEEDQQTQEQEEERDFLGIGQEDSNNKLLNKPPI